MDMNIKPKYDFMFGMYNLLVGAVWLLKVEDRILGVAMASLHMILAAVTLLLPAQDEQTSGWSRSLRLAYPYLLWTLAWSELGWLYNLNSPATFDGPIMALDRALLGTHLNEHLASWLPWGWFSEFMHFTYLSYYLLILGPVVYLAWRNRPGLVDHTSNLMGTYLACFAIYLLWPVLGPRDLLASHGLGTGQPAGIFAPVMVAFFEAGDSLGTAFPSSHCAASLAAALSLFRHVSPRAGRIFLIWAQLIIISTVYANNHYAIDAVAGIVLALAVWRIRQRQQANSGNRGILYQVASGSAGMVVGSQMGTRNRGGVS